MPVGLEVPCAGAVNVTSRDPPSFNLFAGIKLLVHVLGGHVDGEIDKDGLPGQCALCTWGLVARLFVRVGRAKRNERLIICGQREQALSAPRCLNWRERGEALQSRVRHQASSHPARGLKDPAKTAVINHDPLED